MKRKNKYGAVKTKVGKTTYDSKKEARYCEQLKLRQMAGEIKNLAMQPKFEFIVNGEPMRYVNTKRKGKIITYIADACYEENGEFVVVDVKGVETQVFKMKRAMMRHINGLEVQVV